MVATKTTFSKWKRVTISDHVVLFVLSGRPRFPRAALSLLNRHADLL